MRDEFDVIVVGAGNAALCAALEARHRVSRVLLLERSPEYMRGGNTRHTRNIRFAHGPNRFASGMYSEEEFLEDLISVAGPPPNLELAKYVIRESQNLPEWLSAHGVWWQRALAGTLQMERTNIWFLGGGKVYVNSCFEAAKRMGIEIRYNTCVEDFVLESGKFRAVVVKNSTHAERIMGRSVVVASGGFESNLEWLKEYFGDSVLNFAVRGTPYNDGIPLRALFNQGAKSMGNPKGAHCIAVDARAPKYDGGIVTRIDAIPIGIVVNQEGRRFYDEGENIWPKRYAIWGHLIAAQPGQVAYCLVDAKTIGCFLPPMYKPHSADSIENLAALMSVDPKALSVTVGEYNQATAGNANFSLAKLDGLCTRGLQPKKSNWAVPLDRPPFYAIPLRPGITFTYMGLAVDEAARVLEQNGRPLEGVYAAGEIMSGNILTKGYMSGIGLTIGAVSGRLAGRNAAKHA